MLRWLLFLPALVCAWYAAYLITLLSYPLAVLYWLLCAAALWCGWVKPLRWGWLMVGWLGFGLLAGGMAGYAADEMVLVGTLAEMLFHIPVLGLGVGMVGFLLHYVWPELERRCRASLQG